uniref:Uncharacterized protein n=1 Tax=Aegilops tauschii TaxID=37682 RepID=R7W9H0_AEGTA
MDPPTGATAMRCWENLQEDLVGCVGDGVEDLKAIPGPCFGSNSNDGWVAYLSDCWPWPWPASCVFSLFNPMTVVDISLLLLGWESRLVTKVFFAPSPAKDDFTAAAICWVNRLGYIVAGDKEWTILDPLRLHARYQLTDVLFHGKGELCQTLHILLVLQDTNPNKTQRNVKKRSPPAGKGQDPLRSHGPKATGHEAYQRRRREAKEP